MILQALVRYYDILAQDAESGISALGYSRTNISYALNISKDGELLEVLPLKYKVLRGKKEVEVSPVAIVPQQVKKTSGVNSNFLCENSSYTLGIDQKGNLKKSKERFEAFKDLHIEILSGVECDETTALLNFLNNWQVEQALENEAVAQFYDELTAGANLVFKLDCGKYLHECEPIKRAWEQYKNKTSDAPIMQCLITGEQAPIARLNPSIKGVKGAQSVGASIVSFNARAYESYGRDQMQGLNSPISEKAAFSYGTVLNYLLADRPHTLSVGDATVVYWAESPKNTQRNEMAFFFDTDQLSGDEASQVIQDLEARRLVGGILDKIAQGKQISDDVVLNDDTQFYVLGLSPNAARLSIRFFMQNSFGNFAQNIAKHYQDLSIEKQYQSEPNFISPWRMLNQTVSPNAKDKSASPLLGGSVMRAILENRPYPTALFNAVMIRIKAERDINYYKSAMIKAYLTRSNYEKYKEVLSMSLNSQSENTAYLLGRLFAVLEKVQQDANPGINATIKDRYFSSACSTPLTAFPSLLRLSQHHISKAKYGYASENIIAEIMEKLEVENNPFPANLFLEEQGIFVLGYYHQRNDLYTKKSKEKEEGENSHE